MEGSEQGGTPSPSVAVAAAVVGEEKPASEISGMAAEPMKKKTGRPRKYGPDGSLLWPLNPMPISASVPAGVKYTSAAAVGAALKRGRGRPVGSMAKTPQLGFDLEHLGNPCLISSPTLDLKLRRQFCGVCGSQNGPFLGVVSVAFHLSLFLVVAVGLELQKQVTGICQGDQRPMISICRSDEVRGVLDLVEKAMFVGLAWGTADVDACSELMWYRIILRLKTYGEQSLDKNFLSWFGLFKGMDDMVFAAAFDEQHNLSVSVYLDLSSLLLESYLMNQKTREMGACSAGANFTPHVITVASGEIPKPLLNIFLIYVCYCLQDVTMKIISFSQQGPRAICILSANGIISNVALRQPYSSGGTLTYEGRFELLSLSGSFMPTENGGTRSRSGGLSVSLASPDGRVVGGGVAGLLVAASPVQVVVGSFLPSYQMEQKIKKPRLEAGSASTPPSAAPSSSADAEEAFGSGQGQQDRAATGKLDPSTTSPLGEESWAASLRISHGCTCKIILLVQYNFDPQRNLSSRVLLLFCYAVGGGQEKQGKDNSSSSCFVDRLSFGSSISARRC
ncbi:unnamed protein product [Musa acuminata subsp. burmannicoides]